MNKKTLILLAVLFIILISGLGFLRWENTKKAEMEKQAVLQQQQEEEARWQGKDSQTAQIEDIDTGDWKTYKNDRYGFEMKYPKNLTYAFQNAFNPSDGAEFLFYDSKFTDVARDSNPLLAVIGKNTGYIKLIILSKKDFVNKANFDVKSSVTPDLSGPGGEIYATQKITAWTEVKAADKKTGVYFYTTEATELKTAQAMGGSRGAVWVSNGMLFMLENIEFPGDVYKNIAGTFYQK